MRETGGSTASSTPTLGAVLTACGRRLSQIDLHQVEDMFEDAGVVLLRGFDATSEEFVQFSNALTRDFGTYRGGAFRGTSFDRAQINSNPTLLTATGKRQDFPIPLHGEMHYVAHPPELIWFHCVRPALVGGETTIGDAQAIWAALSERARAVFTDSRISYLRTFGAGEWQEVFGLAEAALVDEMCRAQETSTSWDEHGGLTTEYKARAFRLGRRAEPLFINNILVLALGEFADRSGLAARASSPGAPAGTSLVVRLEDGSRIPEGVIRNVLAVCEQLTVPISWSAGDVLMIDNMRVMHGRRTSRGGDRTIHTRMGACSFDHGAAL